MRQILLITYLLLTVHLFGQPVDENGRVYINPSYYSAINQSKEKLIGIMDKYHIPGLSVAVSVGGEAVWAEAFGFADMEDSTPVRLKSRFRIGSVSKSITGVLTGRLYEEGILDIDAPVSKYLPDFPAKRFEITARQLAGHIAGIRHYDYSKQEFLSRVHFENIEEALSIFSSDSLHFEPGTNYEYSTYGYSLLSAEIERASGEDFADLVNEKIFVPAGMIYTVADDNSSIIPNRVKFYSFENGRNINAFYVDNSNKLAGGGFISTPLDLLRFGNSLLEGDIVTQQTLQMIFTSQRLKNGSATGYGFGFNTGKDEIGRNRVWHIGSSVGGRTVLMIYPAERVIIAVTCNLLAGFDEKETGEIADMFIENYFSNIRNEKPVSGSGN